jgi:hypothetical protein
VYDDIGLDYFDFLRDVLCSGTQEELVGSQLGGAPPTGTEEGGGTQLGRSQLPGAPPIGTQSSGGMQPSLGGLPGSYHQVVGAAAVMATPPAVADDRRRQIHPCDPLRYPRDQTWAAARVDRLHQEGRRC